MKTYHLPFFSTAILALLALNLSGCAVGPQAKTMQIETANSIKQAQEKTIVTPVITNIAGAWLMGQSIKVAPPASPILSTQITYHPAQRVSLPDIASYITLEKGLIIDVSEVQTNPGTAGSAPTPTPGLGGMVQPMGMPQQTVGMGGAGGVAAPQTIQSMLINYEGTVSGLLDIMANKAAVWWKFTDGKVVFYRTETKTFYLPTNARKSTGNSIISTTAGGSGTGGTSVTDDYIVDVWGDMEKTAKAVGSGAQVIANASAGSITVTGTPAQVRAVADWVKGLTEQLSQQVAITVRMYRIKVTNEDTYNWDPSIVFKKAAGTYGFDITPTTPLISASGATPVGLALSVLTGAPGAWGQYSGSKAALQALSTLGNVSETMQETFVTLNGQPAQKQIATQQGYLASSSTTQTTGAGATTTITPGSITVGFTATFLPRIVNGKVILNMAMTNSSSNGFATISSGGSTIQTPNIDLSTFQQSVSLTPGDALLLTGVQQDKSKSNNSGVGSPDFTLLGGGVNNNIDKSMIAIVITAKVL